MIEYWTKHTDWYFERFYLHSQTTATYREAWERTEQEHYDRFEFYRYEGYDQFRAAKSNYHIKKHGPKDSYDKNQMKLWG